MGGYLGDPRGREAAIEDRQGRDDFSFEDRRAARSGYSGSYDKGPGATTKTTFYLDETPSLVEQKVAAVPAVKNPFKD